MAYILWAKGEEAFVNTVLGNVAVSPAIPAAAGNWGLGMAAPTGGVWAGGGSVTLALKQRAIGTNVATTVAEIAQVGSVNNNGYARIGIVRSSAGWPAATNAANADNYSSTAPQKTFTFTGSPNLNGATCWMVCKSTTAWTNTSTPTDDLMFGADLAATRNFANGDTENITCTYKQT